jgi:hypothetical protein
VVVVMVVTAPGHMHLAVFMVPMPAAIEVRPVGVSVHVTMMVAMPVISIDVDVVSLLHNPILARRGRMERCSLDRCAGERQSNGCTEQ